jgi:hypothetical protein
MMDHHYGGVGGPTDGAGRRAGAEAIVRDRIP